MLRLAAACVQARDREHVHVSASTFIITPPRYGCLDHGAGNCPQRREQVGHLYLQPSRLPASYVRDGKDMYRVSILRDIHLRAVS